MVSCRGFTVLGSGAHNGRGDSVEAALSGLQPDIEVWPVVVTEWLSSHSRANGLSSWGGK